MAYPPSRVEFHSSPDFSRFPMLKEATEPLRRAIIGSTFQDLITMLTSKILATTVLLFLAPLASAQDTTTTPPVAAPTTAAVPAVAAEFAVFHTNKGDIVIEFNRAKAPISVENFVGYIKDGFFDNTLFHRVVAGFVIQGGGFDTANKQKTTKAPIANEWENGLKNDRGTLSMARTSDPNSATSQFFINLKDNAALDTPRGGAAYAVFGKVVVGMNVVDQIAAVKCTRQGGNPEASTPIEPLITTKAEMISMEAAAKLMSAQPAAATTPATATPGKPVTPAAPGKPVTPVTPDAPGTPKTKPGTPATPTP
jgi:cyclophilin family peptidyl-prolyl cis-trans isomerase